VAARISEKYQHMATAWRNAATVLARSQRKYQAKKMAAIA